MRDGTLRIAALLLLLVTAGCESHHGPTTSSASLSTVDDVSIKPLTAEFSNQTVRYQVTAQVTNPQNLVGGTGELTVAASGEARRHGAPLEVGQVLASAPITEANLRGNQLAITFEIKNPPAGTLPLDFLVIDSKGFTTNSSAVSISIKNPPPPPPSSPPSPPSGPGTLVIHAVYVAGSAILPSGFDTVFGLSIIGPTPLGPLTITVNTTQTFTVNNGPYTTSVANGYLSVGNCPATPFTVNPGTTVTLTYSFGKVVGPPIFPCTVQVS